MVRLRDLAREAGVSVMTVSRALRGAPEIAATTKARIRTLAEQRGYVPDALAQGLRTNTTRLFGVVLPTLSDPVWSRGVAALEERASDLGCSLLVAQSLGQPDREEDCIRRLLARRVDGLFIAPVYRLSAQGPIYAALARRAAKVVLLGQRALFCQQFVSVETDDVQASAQATRHLLALGHRRIAFLAGPVVSPTAQERFEGYRRAHREAGLELDDRLLFNAGVSFEDGAKAALQMLAEAANATALQAVNDLVAIGAAETFLRQGIRIPEQISVVGFGNLLPSAHFRVPLTTLRQPKYRAGLVAMESMLALLRGQQVQTRRLPADLLIRASTAPPPPSTLAPGPKGPGQD